MFKDFDSIFRKLFDAVPYNIFYKDSNSLYLLCNKSCARYLKIKQKDVKGKSDYDFFPDKIARRHRADDRTVIRKKRAVESELRHMRNGKERVMRTLKTPIIGSRGSVTGIFGILWDTARYKKPEEALLESEERFRQVAETAGGWIWEVDVKGLYTYASPTVKKALGYKPGELVGKKHFYDLFVPGRKAKLKREAARVFKTRRPFRGFVNENVHKDGSIVYMETSGLPILSKSGRLLGYRGTDTDVTDRKKAEEALYGLKNNLEIEVRKKTRELMSAYRELESSRRLAGIGALAATVAHELRNPLGVIRAALYNIKRKSNNNSIASHLNNIDKKITESDNIIENLLVYSKVIPPKYRSVSVRELINESVSDFKSKYDFSRIKVNIDCRCKRNSRIEADPVQMKGLFLNILDNAYQSFHGKRGVIDIKGSCNLRRNRLRIDFIDNGCGISKDSLGRLFEPFFTTKAKGIGLGLAVCKKIIGLHKGSMKIFRKKPRGTKVSVTLPISRG